jgi:hypothetical protein
MTLNLKEFSSKTPRSWGFTFIILLYILYIWKNIPALQLISTNINK